MKPVITFTGAIKAELIKLKRTPILWIVLISGFLVPGMLFLIYFFNVEDFSKRTGDPWLFFFDLGFMLTAMLFLAPFLVLVCSSVVYSEHSAGAWKYLYALPLKKGSYYFSKLLTVMLLILLSCVLFVLSVVLTAYLLDLFHPVYGFRSYPPALGHLLLRLLHALLSILGLIALHYWLSMRWKSFIAPIGIGLLGFIMAIFVVFIGQRFDLGVWLPYAYPMLTGLEFGSEPLGLEYWGWFTRVEVYSIGLFVLFCGVGFYEEWVKNVK